MLRRTEDGKMVGATATAATEVTGRSIVIAGNLSFGAGIEGSYRPKGQFDSFDCASMMYVEMIEPEPGHAFAQLVWRVEPAQDAACRGLFRTVIHGLRKNLLRS